MEQAYADKTERLRRGAVGTAFMQGWGWPAQVDRLLGAVAEFN